MTPDTIRARRLALGLSQTELARILLVGTGTISTWERGQNVPMPYLDLALRYIEDRAAAKRAAQAE